MTQTVPCSERPTDPLCTGADGGGDGGHDANADAHVPCNGECSAPTGECLVEGSTETCVECLGDPDCSGGEVCDTTGTHECVGCVDSSTCTSPTASRCDETTSTCAECMGNSDCEHLASTPVCDEGTCVQCASNADCEATEGCSPNTHTCVPFTPGSAGTCDECVRDSECAAGQLCIAMTYDDPNTPATDPVAAGQHCLWRQDATGTGAPNGNCVTFRPYFPAAITSVDGEATTVCGLRSSTCAAQAAFSLTDCMSADAAGHARCGLTGVNDGVCRHVPLTSSYLCSVYCESDLDCRGTRTCDTGVTPPVCNF